MATRAPSARAANFSHATLGCVSLKRTAEAADLFATTPADRLATAAIIRHLTALEDRPWADDAQGHPLTPRHLATLLEGFQIKAKQIRQGADTRKGYLRSDFTDAFRRYLPPDPKHCQRRGAGRPKRAAALASCFGRR